MNNKGRWVLKRAKHPRVWVYFKNNRGIAWVGDDGRATLATKPFGFYEATTLRLKYWSPEAAKRDIDALFGEYEL